MAEMMSHNFELIESPKMIHQLPEQNLPHPNRKIKLIFVSRKKRKLLNLEKRKVKSASLQGVPDYRTFEKRFYVGIHLPFSRWSGSSEIFGSIFEGGLRFLMSSLSPGPIGCGPQIPRFKCPDMRNPEISDMFGISFRYENGQFISHNWPFSRWRHLQKRNGSF